MLCLDFSTHDVTRFLHGAQRLLVIARLLGLKGKAAFHDGCMEKDIDGIRHGDTETRKYVFCLCFDDRVNAHIDACCFGHGSTSFYFIVTQK